MEKHNESWNIMDLEWPTEFHCMKKANKDHKSRQCTKNLSPPSYFKAIFMCICIMSFQDHISLSLPTLPHWDANCFQDNIMLFAVLYLKNINHHKTHTSTLQSNWGLRQELHLVQQDLQILIASQVRKLQIFTVWETTTDTSPLSIQRKLLLSSPFLAWDFRICHWWL